MLQHFRTVSYSIFFVGLLVGVGCKPATDSHDHSVDNKEVQEKVTFSGEYPIQVVCTTGQVTELMQRIGGEHIAVSGLMGPGIDPHLFRAAPADNTKLQEADLIVYNGLHLEGKMSDILHKLGSRKPVWAVTDSLVEAADPRLRKPPQFDGAYDPHVWHAPLIWADCVKAIIKRLQSFDPDHYDDYERNGSSYLSNVKLADKFCRENIATIPEDQRILVTAHDAFEYFCAEYGLEAQALKGISTDDEVSIQRMDDVVNLIVERKVKAVFVETAVAHRIVEAVVEPCLARGHTVVIGGELYADALGPVGSEGETYLGMIKANVQTIVSGLNGSGE